MLRSALSKVGRSLLKKPPLFPSLADVCSVVLLERGRQVIARTGQAVI